MWWWDGCSSLEGRKWLQQSRRLLCGSTIPDQHHAKSTKTTWVGGMTRELYVGLTRKNFFPRPFPHFYSPQALPPGNAVELLLWLEKCESWKLVQTNFYEQLEFSLVDANVPNNLAFLTDRLFLSAIMDSMAESFRSPLSDEIEIVAHKLIPGQNIGIHNDYLKNGETHRLVIQLNFGWSENCGGRFMVFNSSNVEDVARVINPIHNSAVGFEISTDSHHAVSVIHEQVRYSLVYSFKALK